MENKKVLGFCILHYSGDFLKESLLSIRDNVDKMVIAYSGRPSQGHVTDLPYPDKIENIIQICKEVLGEKLIWDEAASYPSEAHHRDVRYKYAQGYDAILTCDADEVMLGIPEALNYAFAHEEQYFGIRGYRNFFRSFSWYFKDDFRPIRIEVLGRNNQRQNLECPMEILHFSCCQRKEVMIYKYKSFGHASEIPADYLDKFYSWSPEKIDEITHLHPASRDIWVKPEFFDKELMPDYLKIHPNYTKELI